MTAAAATKRLRVGDTGTVLIVDIDCESIVTRDLSDEERSVRAIEDYARAYAEKQALPPVEVFLVDGRMVLVDGDHRVKARVAMGALGVTARCVGEGDAADAMRYALGNTNKGHGLRLSAKDCRRRVMQALDAELWDGSSANAIAGKLGLSHNTVSKYMGEWEDARRIAAPKTRVDTKGRVQPTTKPRKRDVVTDNVEAERDAEKLLPLRGPEALGAPVEEPANVPQSATAKPMPAYGDALEALAKQIKAARLEVGRVVPDALNGIRQQAITSLANVESSLTLAVPVVCSECEGAGCDTCGQRGWRTRQQVGSKRA